MIVLLPEGLNRIGRKTPLEASPVSHQLTLMQLCPGLSQALLAAGKRSRDHLDRIDPDDCHVVLVICVKVWAVVMATDLDEHAYDDAEEP
jgi:hypothetical protein